MTWLCSHVHISMIFSLLDKKHISLFRESEGESVCHGGRGQLYNFVGLVFFLPLCEGSRT